jgi:peptide/nickel transport system ATP-binding protein
VQTSRGAVVVSPPSAELDTTVAAPVLAGTSLVACVQDLTVDLQRNGQTVHAIRGVSLDIAPGEILGLVGESGSGKSVLGLTLLGLLPEQSQPRTTGKVLVAGTDMLTSSADVRRANRREHLGAVFQDPMTSLNPTMKVGRQVAEAAGSGSEALRLLQAVGIPDPARRMDSFPFELSGGLRQRVMIAMAVAGNPTLIVADEPTTALDVTVQAQVLALLRSLRDELGCSVLMITHDLGVAAQVADRVAVMYAGRLAEIGETSTVLSSPAHPYTVGLMRSRLRLNTDRDRPVATLPGGAPDPASPPPGCAFKPRCVLATDECEQTLPAPEPVVPLTELQVSDGAGHLRACIVPAESVLELASAPITSEAGSEFAAKAVSTDGEPALVAKLADISRNFSVKAGGRRKVKLAALRGIDLEVAAGESVAIVGESGSGKSTLLRIVAGLDRQTAGRVDLTGRPPQMVFQDAGASLTPWMTVGDLIAERLRADNVPRGERRARVLAALQQVGLPDAVADARAAELSGGQRQRVALARATVVPPDVLLCDEPTSALDVSLAATVLNLLQILRRDLNMAMLFVTHDLSVARIVADRIAVMYCGRIVEIGDAEQIIAAPKHPYTKALLSAVPDVGVQVPPMAGEPASPLAPPTGCGFHPRCPIAEPSCSDVDLVVPLERLRVGGNLLVDADQRRVACIRPGEL